MNDMKTNEQPTPQTPTGGSLSGLRSTALGGVSCLEQVNAKLSDQTVELIDNLDEWADEMRKGKHPATLTMLRASAALKTLLAVSAEAYVFAAREHPATQPWRNALNTWKKSMECANIVVPTR